MLQTPTTPPPSLSRDQAAPRTVANPTSQATLQRQPAKQQTRSSLWLKSFLVAAILISAIAAVGAIIRRSGPELVDGTTLTHTIKRGDLRVTVTEKGTLESSNNVEVRSKVWGWKTVNWVIENGAIVSKGDLLVELDSSEMEKKVDDAKINYHNSRADMITAESNVTVAEKSIDEYLLGTFVEEQGTINQEIFDAEQAVAQAELAYNSAERMAAKGLIKPLQLKGEKFKLDSASQKLALKKTRLTSLQDFKKVKQQEKMESDLRAAEARLDAAKARVDLSTTNVTQHEEQLSYHTIVAPQDGMVIHPKAAAHRDAPDVEEGANVHTNQVLLIMPDLTQMQVKLGIHESMIDRVDEGLLATVTVGDVVLTGKVSEVAKVTKPATWYTGNVVKFDTIVSLEASSGLKPGLSAEVEVVIAEHEDVLTIPVAAVVETGEERHCWIKTPSGPQHRKLELGDSNEQFIIVKSGLKEGDEVVLNPVAFIDEAQSEVLKPIDESTQQEEDSAVTESEASGPGSGEYDSSDSQ
jgi:multidrug efflux pump subunit AcrA (membrane-fusion protein)